MAQREKVLDIIRQHEGHDRTLVVPRAFITLSGDLHSALLLSQLLYWTDRAASHEGWVYKTRPEWIAELGGTRYTLDGARRRLRALGLIEESIHLVRNRRTLHLRLRYPQFLEALEAILAREGASPTVSCPSPDTDAFRDTPAPSVPPARVTRAQSRLLHRDLLLARASAKAAAAASSSEVEHVDSSTCCVPAHRCAGEEPTDVRETATSMCGPSKHRCVEYQQVGVLERSTSRTGITPETTPEISAETSSSARGVMGSRRTAERRSAKGEACDERQTVAACPCGRHRVPTLCGRFTNRPYIAPPHRTGGHRGPPLHRRASFVVADAIRIVRVRHAAARPWRVVVVCGVLLRMRGWNA